MFEPSEMTPWLSKQIFLLGNPPNEPAGVGGPDGEAIVLSVLEELMDASEYRR